MAFDESVAISEENFHDEWAASMTLDDLDVYAAFTATTVPEFHYAREALGELDGKMLLDAGCGPGESSIYLANQGAQVTAVDISSGMIKVGRDLANKFKVPEDRLRFIQTPVEQLQFPDNSFDLVFGSNVIHHCNIDLASQELARVLKPGGRAVFVDPLGYNPIINKYRKMAFKVRTPDEHPLVYKDFDTIGRHFQSIHYKEFQLTTLGIFLWFYLGERIHPSEERYWRKFVLEGERYKKAFNFLFSIDNFLLKRIPPLRRYCWNVVTICIK